MIHFPVQLQSEHWAHCDWQEEEHCDWQALLHCDWQQFDAAQLQFCTLPLRLYRFCMAALISVMVASFTCGALSLENTV
jgi:hypothetical protein